MKHDAGVVGPHYGNVDLEQWVRAREAQSYVVTWSIHFFEVDAGLEDVQVVLEYCC
jgi:hypothetical protein